MKETKRHSWKLVREDGEEATYNKSLGFRVTADHTRTSPAVIKWAEGMKFVVVPT